MNSVIEAQLELEEQKLVLLNIPVDWSRMLKTMSEAELHLFRRKYDPDYGVQVKNPYAKNKFS